MPIRGRAPEGGQGGGRLRAGTKRRRADYARVPKLYRANCSECSRKILSGDWENEATPGIPLEDQVIFWSRVFGEESVADECSVRPQGMVL